MIKYVVVNGKPESGKTTFENICGELAYEVEGAPVRAVNISTIDIIKATARMLGWDGVKTPETRKFLSDLKKMANETFDTSWNYVINLVHSCHDSYMKEFGGNDKFTLIVFVDSREPEEIARFKKMKRATTLLITRDSTTENEESNTSDANVFHYNYDTVIENNGTIEDLTNQAKLFIIDLLKRGNGREG